MDLERIYVNLPQMDQHVDTVVFTLNIYTGAAEFSKIESAYVRLVNADTNQELCRIQLGGGCMRGNAIVFAKLYRYMDSWQIMGLGMPIVCRGGTWQATVPAILASGCAFPPPPDSSSHVPLAVAVTAPATPEGRKVQKPTKLHKTPPLAVSSAEGVAAAGDIFTCDALTIALLEPHLFSVGVDFTAGACAAMVDAMPEMDLCSAADFASDFHWAHAVGAVGEWVGGAAGVVGKLGSGAVSAAGSAGQRAGGALGDAAAGVGDLVSNAHGVGRGVFFQATAAVGEMAGGAVDAVSATTGGAVAIVGDAASGVAGIAGSAAGAVADVAGAAVGLVCDVVVLPYQAVRAVGEILS
jgi:hypothetical protein